MGEKIKIIIAFIVTVKVVAIIGAVLVYISFSFIETEANCFSWSVDTRQNFIAGMWGVLTVASIIGMFVSLLFAQD